MKLKKATTIICYSLAAAFVTTCESGGVTSQDQQLISPWIGREAISSKTTSLNYVAKLWTVAPPGAEGFIGSVKEFFYFSKGVRFKITGVEINRSYISGPNIFIIVNSPTVMSGQKVYISTRDWGPPTLRKLSFEQQLRPENFRLFFENNSNFHFVVQ